MRQALADIAQPWPGGKPCQDEMPPCWHIETMARLRRDFAMTHAAVFLVQRRAFCPIVVLCPGGSTGHQSNKDEAHNDAPHSDLLPPALMPPFQPWHAGQRLRAS